MITGTTKMNITVMFIMKQYCNRQLANLLIESDFIITCFIWDNMINSFSQVLKSLLEEGQTSLGHDINGGKWRKNVQLEILVIFTDKKREI